MKAPLLDMALSLRSQANAPDAPDTGGTNANQPAASGSGSQAASTTAPGVLTARAPFHQAKLEIPLLDDSGDSYTQWCKTVTLVLRYRGLWDVVDSTTPTSDPTMDAQAHLDWSRHDQEAHLQFILALSRAPHDHVLDVTMSKEVWDMLKAQYQGSGELRSHYLLERLFTTPLVDSEPMEPQIASIVSIVCQLNAINFPISDQWLTGMLRVKLPASWNTLKTVLAHVDDGKLMSKGVITQILAEEHCRIRKDRGNAKAYYVKSSNKGKGKQKHRRDKQCSHCDRKGHDITECYTLKWEQEEEASKTNSRSSKANSRSGTPSSNRGSGKSTSSKSTSSKSASAKIAKANASSLDLDSDGTIQVYMARAALAPSTPKPTIERVYKTKAELCRSNLQNSWLIDSSMSRTMCSHCSWFTSLSPLSNHCKVVLGDDSSIPATGTGRVCIRMHTKGRWITSVLQDVLYVPDLSANLLSVSHLAHCGTEVCFIGEACHVYDKTKSPILKGKLCNDLYIMQMHADSLVMAKMATLVLHLENASETPARALMTRLTSSTGSLDLWHRRLGHLHTKAVTRMADKGLVTSMEISDRKPRA
jgi:hypothetical protein